MKGDAAAYEVVDGPAEGSLCKIRKHLGALLLGAADVGARGSRAAQQGRGRGAKWAARMAVLCILTPTSTHRPGIV